MALRRLESAQAGRAETIRRATRIIHDGIAHIRPEDVRTKGLEHYRMRVPVYENWVLYLLSFVKPDTYRDYEFCRFERALKRGTGRCGQQALALVDYLSSIDIPTGFVALGGHAIATAQTEGGAWYLLDPDYGAVIPFDLKTAEENPEKVLEHYWGPAAVTNRIDHLYDKEDNIIRYGGPEIRYPRACRVETAAYILKWLMPALLLGGTIALWNRTGREHAVTT